MISDRELEDRLFRAGQEIASRPSMAGDVMQVIDESAVVPVRPSRARTFVLRAGAALAAAIVVAAVATALYLATGAGLYAQVIRAFDNARRLHIVGEALRDGRLEKQMEVFWERGVGVAEYGYSGKSTSMMRIDDGRFQWLRYDTGPVYRSASKDTESSAAKTFRALARLLDQTNSAAVKEPETLIHGVPCVKYVLAGPPPADDTERVVAYVDRDHRVPRFERQHMAAGQWETYRVLTVEYDGAIDRNEFKPRWGVEVKVVDGEDALKRFNPDDAVFKKEMMGILVAVHRLKRLENGMVFMVYSTRPTKETLAKWGEPKGSNLYGDFWLNPNWSRIDGKDRSYQPLDLAMSMGHGMKIGWMVIIRSGQWPLDEFEIDANVDTSLQLRDELTRAGRESRARFRPLATLPLPAEETTLDAALRETYSELAATQGVMFQTTLCGRWEASPFDPKCISHRILHPRSCTMDDYVAEVRQEIMEELMKRAGKAQ